MEVLSLTSARWAELQHAYGSAVDVPNVIRALERPGPIRDQDAWEFLWGSVHHQGTVYDACYATVPHIVRIALSNDGPCAWDFLAFPASVEINRHGSDAVPIPSDLANDYATAISLLADAVHQHSRHDWDHVFGQAAAAALLVSRGQFRLADAVLELGPEVVEELFERLFEGDGV